MKTHLPGDPKLRDWRFYPATLGAATAIALLFAWATTGLAQGIALVAVGLFASLCIASVERLSQQVVFRVLTHIAIAAVGVLIGLVVSRYSSRSADVPVLPYPRADGLIADFASGPGGPARSALGTQFSIFSDSVFNVGSKIWYERLDEPNTNGNGFLRIHYQLEPSSALGPYVGLYVDFSTPPPVSYNLSQFRRVAMRLRSEPSSTVNPIDVAVVLYSANVTNFEYAFPRWQVPRQNLRPEWTAVNGAFADFLSPPFVSYDVTLDPARTYRLGLLISAERPEPVHGHIDVDDLRFE